MAIQLDSLRPAMIAARTTRSDQAHVVALNTAPVRSQAVSSTTGEKEASFRSLLAGGVAAAGAASAADRAAATAASAQALASAASAPAATATSAPAATWAASSAGAGGTAPSGTPVPAGSAGGGQVSYQASPGQTVVSLVNPVPVTSPITQSGSNAAGAAQPDEASGIEGFYGTIGTPEQPAVPAGGDLSFAAGAYQVNEGAEAGLQSAAFQLPAAVPGESYQQYYNSIYAANPGVVQGDTNPMDTTNIATEDAISVAAMQEFQSVNG